MYNQLSHVSSFVIDSFDSFHMKHSQFVNHHLQTTCHLNKRNLLRTIVEEKSISAYLHDRLRVNELLRYNKDLSTIFSHLWAHIERTRGDQEESREAASDSVVTSAVVLLLLIEHILVDHNNTNNSKRSKQQRVNRILSKVVI